jgi:hypothetical protein
MVAAAPESLIAPVKPAKPGTSCVLIARLIRRGSMDWLRMYRGRRTLDVLIELRRLPPIEHSVVPDNPDDAI